jgi:ATP-dependent exoDNAse (exonuclease V) alpha subunit
VDEVSMVCEVFYKQFFHMKKMIKDVKFIMSGDFRQYAPVKDRLGEIYYQKSRALLELCDSNRLVLTTCRREMSEEKELFHMLKEENIEQLTANDFGKEQTLYNICFTNNKRKELNETCMKKIKQWKKRAGFELKKLDYDANSQDIEVYKGTPLIARKTTNRLKILNNETFVISKINEKIIKVRNEKKGDIEIPYADFRKLFYVAYAITSHKAQGITIDEPYTIHEFNKMNENGKYVVLSRATAKKYINVI